LKEIFCRSVRCYACKSCEIACSVVHSRSGELVPALREEPPPVRRVRVICIEPSEDHTERRTVAVQCRHCEDPPCVDACITDAITKDEETGLVTIDEDLCVGCWSCSDVCPHGAIVQVPEEVVAVICDRCQGRRRPACVESCPTGALVFMESVELEGLERSEEKDER